MACWVLLPQPATSIHAASFLCSSGVAAVLPLRPSIGLLSRKSEVNRPLLTEEHFATECLPVLLPANHRYSQILPHLLRFAATMGVSDGLTVPQEMAWFCHKWLSLSCLHCWEAQSSQRTRDGLVGCRNHGTAALSTLQPLQSQLRSKLCAVALCSFSLQEQQLHQHA